MFFFIRVVVNKLSLQQILNTSVNEGVSYNLDRCEIIAWFFYVGAYHCFSFSLFSRINSLSLAKGTKRKKEQQQQPEQQPQQQQQELQQHNLQVSSPAPVVTSIPFTNVSSPSTIDVRMVTNPNITVPTFSMDVENQDAAYQG